MSAARDGQLKKASIVAQSQPIIGRLQTLGNRPSSERMTMCIVRLRERGDELGGGSITDSTLPRPLPTVVVRAAQHAGVKQVAREQRPRATPAPEFLAGV
jgi:hypothetical protein